MFKILNELVEIPINDRRTPGGHDQAYKHIRANTTLGQNSFWHRTIPDWNSLPAAPFLPIDTRALMFKTMVLPHLDYCCTIWGTTSDTNIGKLHKIQNCGMRIILQCHPRTHIADMISNLK